MKKGYRIIYLISVSLSITHLLNAQTRTLDSLVILSTGEFRPTIADANKISETPSVNDSTKKINVSKYSISSKKINTPFDVTPIAAAQMVGEPLTKLYQGLAKAGFGNYSTPYAEVWYNSLRNKDYNYGIRLKHISSTAWLKDYGFAGYSDNEIALNGKKFLKEHTLSGGFDYTRNVVHFYGYDRDMFDLKKEATVQRFNLFAANAGLTSHYTKAERFQHEVKLSYYNLADLYKASENNLKATGFIQKKIDKELLKVDAGVDFYNYKTAKDTVNNTLISLQPSFSASGEKYQASIGVSAVMDVQVQSKFYFYPIINLSYNVLDNIIVPYAGAKGGLQKNSFKNITDENPFVLSSLQMKNTDHRYELYGGVKGSISSQIGYNARASYENVTNMMLYVNDFSDLLQNRFTVIYDDAKVLNIHGEVSYQDKERLRILLYGDYYNYKMKTELRAWYKPQVKIGASANYNIENKIIVKLDLYYLDNQLAKYKETNLSSADVNKISAKELKNLFDVNLGVEYMYTKRLGFFLNLTNIAAVRYQRWLNYPTQRFGILAGASFAF